MNPAAFFLEPVFRYELHDGERILHEDGDCSPGVVESIGNPYNVMYL